MYIVFTYKCPACQLSATRFVRRDMMDSQFCLGPHSEEQADRGDVPYGCRNHRLQKMTRLPAGTRTHFRHNDKKLKA